MAGKKSQMLLNKKRQKRSVIRSLSKKALLMVVGFSKDSFHDRKLQVPGLKQKKRLIGRFSSVETEQYHL